MIAMSACTRLGPMPATTGVSAIPGGQPGGEVQAGFVPGFYLSEATRDRARGEAIPALSGLFDVARLISPENVILGFRMFGSGNDMPGEPFVGWRQALAHDVWLGGVVYGSSTSATSRGASYDALRLGAEAMVDARLVEIAERFAVHVQASVSATHVDAKGSYCTGPNDLGVDCDGGADGNSTARGHLAGVFPAGTATLALDFARSQSSYLHGVRVALVGAAGLMPLLQNGTQVGSWYGSIGVLVTIGFGAR